MCLSLLIVMLIDLAQKFAFPCFIEFMLYFYHFLNVFYYFLFNQRLLEHCLGKTLCLRQNIFFLTENDKNIFVCYKVTRKLSFLIFKFELFYTDFFNINKKSQQSPLFLIKILATGRHSFNIVSPRNFSNLSNKYFLRSYFSCKLHERSGFMNKTIISGRTHETSDWQHKHLFIRCVLQLMMTLLYVEKHFMDKCLCCQSDVQCVLQLMMTLLYGLMKRRHVQSYLFLLYL